MRGLPLALAALAGCRPSLKGWWDVTEWRVERDGADPVVRADAGVVVWQAEGSLADFGAAYHVMRYDYDPVAFDLVPDPDGELVRTDWAFEEWDKDLPIELDWIEGDQYYTVSFDVVQLQPQHMVLEGQAPLGDPAVWVWDLVR